MLSHLSSPQVPPFRFESLYRSQPSAIALLIPACSFSRTGFCSRFFRVSRTFSQELCCPWAQILTKQHVSFTSNQCVLYSFCPLYLCEGGCLTPSLPPSQFNRQKELAYRGLQDGRYGRERGSGKLVWWQWPWLELLDLPLSP